MFIYMFFTVNKISRVQEEIIASGAFPAITIARAKQEALDILEDRQVAFDERLETINRTLSSQTQDSEALELLKRLNEKLKE
jgi:hypothetical protein